MIRSLAILVLIAWQADARAQLMLEREPPHATGRKVLVASEVPKALGKGATLHFEDLDICFDGGSYGAFFTRENKVELVLFFPHPLYWSPKAKNESKQPVAIQTKSALVEIRHGSPLESRLLDLLAADIVDGQRARDETLTLIRIRDCLLHRKPLREITDGFDPETWEPRADPFSFGERNPFDTANENGPSDKPHVAPKSP